MKVNNFWGPSRSSGEKMGMIVRLSLTLIAMAGSITLAWVLLGGHYAAHASSLNTTGTATNPVGIAFDSSGNAWVAEPNCDPAPTCVAPTNGQIQEFKETSGLPSLVKSFTPPSTGHFNPTFLVVDTTGHVWFTDPTNNDIGELTISSDTWKIFTTGLSANEQPYGIVLDKHGNIWFTERAGPPQTGTQGTSKIGFLSPAASTPTVVETKVLTPNSQPFGMTYDTATDTVWFTEDTQAKIGNFVTSSNGTITIHEFSTAASLNNPPSPHMITDDQKGHLWYSEGGSDLVGEFTVATSTAQNFSVAGAICPTPGVTPTTCINTYISGIAVDGLGQVWFDEVQNHLIGALNPTTGQIVASYPAVSGSYPAEGLAVDSLNNVWVTMLYGKTVGVIGAGSPTPTPTSSPPSPTGTPLPTLPPGPVSSTWYFAEGHIGQGFQEYLTIQNPDPVNSCSVQLQYLLASGTPITRIITVNTNTRLTENVNQDLGISRSSSTAEDVSTIVTVINSSSCKGVVAERPMYFINLFGASSGHDALGATKLNTSFYFPDVASYTGYRDFITILNPLGGSSANVTVTYYKGGNTMGTSNLTVPTGTRGTITPPNFGQHTSAVVNSSQPVAVERPAYFTNYSAGNAGIVSGATVAVGAPAPATDWRFAEGYIGGKFQEYLDLANFSATPVTANVVLEYDNGATLTDAVTVPAWDVSYLDVNNITNSQTGTCSASPCLLTQNVSAEVTVTGSGNLVVERQIYFQYLHNANGRSLGATGGTDIIGQSALTTTSYSFAEGYTNTSYDEWLTLQNPTTSPETIYVTLVNGNGSVYSFAVQVNQKSRYTVDIVQTVLAHMCAPGAPSQCWEISMTVQTLNSAPFVAERPMYYNASGSQGGTDVLGYTGG